MDLIAVAVGAVQGAMFAARFRENRLDLLGVAVIGLVIGLGGGLARDLLLNVVPASMQSNWYLLTASAFAIIGMLLLRVFTKLNPLIIGLDALTIGLFCAIGVAKALSVGLPAIPTIFVGVVAAVGGSVIRDMLLNLPVALMHVGSLYAVAAGAGATFMVVSAHLGMPMTWAGVGCTVIAAVTRLASVKWGWSLPEQRALSSWPTWRRKGKPPVRDEDNAARLRADLNPKNWFRMRGSRR